MENGDKHRWWLPVAIMLVAALAYAQTLPSKFVWDERIVILDHPFYRNPELLWPALQQPFVLSPDYWRPLVVISFFVDFVFWGFTPFGFHLTNLFLHVLTSALVFSLIRRALRQQTLAALGGLLFALHPVHVEAVAFVSGRFDLMATLFYLLALWFGTTEGKTTLARLGWAALAGVAALLALGAKEMALTLWLVLPLYALAVNLPSRLSLEQQIIRILPATVAVLLATLQYLLVRQLTLDYLFRLTETLAAGDALQRALLVGHSIVRYVVLLIWPFGTLAPIQYADLPLSPSNPLYWIESLVALALIGATVVLALRRPRLGGFLLCFWLSMGMVINIQPLGLGGGSFIAERFLYLPSFFFILAVLEAVRAWLARPVARRALPAVAGGLLGAFAVTTLLTVPYWYNDETLWLWGKGPAPKSSTPYSNLALQAVEDDQPLLGLYYAEQAILRDPSNASAHNNRGLALVYLQRPAEAEGAFRRAIELEPNNALYRSNLAGALRGQERLEEAEQVLLQEALPRDPTLGAAHFVLGLVYLDMQRPDQAIEPLRNAMHLQPQDQDVRVRLASALALTKQSAEAMNVLANSPAPTGNNWIELGDALALGGDLATALAAYQNAAQAGADPVVVAIRRANMLGGLQQLDAAQTELTNALSAAPEDPRLHNEIGVLLRARGDSENAMRAFSEAARLSRNWPVPGDNLGLLLAAEGRNDEAAQVFAEVAQVAPTYPDVYVHWGELLWAQDKQDEAKQKFARYLELAPQGPLAERARAYLNDQPPQPPEQPEQPQQP
jgi:Tfp pilus assembly protein PilF